MDTQSTLMWMLYLLAGVGLAITLLLAFLGGSLVFQALRFAVTLAFAEHKWKRLRKASAEARAEVNSQTTDNDNDSTTQEATSPKPPQRGSR